MADENPPSKIMNDLQEGQRAFLSVLNAEAKIKFADSGKQFRDAVDSYKSLILKAYSDPYNEHEQISATVMNAAKWLHDNIGNTSNPDMQATIKKASDDLIAYNEQLNMLTETWEKVGVLKYNNRDWKASHELYQVIPVPTATPTPAPTATATPTPAPTPVHPVQLPFRNSKSKVEWQEPASLFPGQ